MMYIPRVSLLEAAPVQLGDSRLVVVSIDGKAEVIAADSFHRLFRPAEADGTPLAAVVVDKPAHPWSKKGRKEKEERVAPAARKAPVVALQKPAAAAEVSDLSTTEAVMQAVAEEARTQAETQDVVCVKLGWPVLEKKYRDRVYQAIWVALKTGKLEKRTDPNTQLSKLYIPGGAK